MTVFDIVTQAKLAEVPVGVAPRSVAIAQDGRAWVTNKKTGSISIIDPDSFVVVDTITMPYASQPFGLVMSPTGNDAYVTLQATGKLLKIHTQNQSTVGSVDTGPHPRGVSINGNE